MRRPTPSRRRFLQVLSTLSLSATIVKPSAVFGASADGTLAPSNRITMGFIGVGKQGTGHLGAIVRRSDINILAVADVQEERRKNAKDVIDKATGNEDPKDKDKDKDKKPDTNTNVPWVV